MSKRIPIFPDHLPIILHLRGYAVADQASNICQPLEIVGVVNQALPVGMKRDAASEPLPYDFSSFADGGIKPRPEMAFKNASHVQDCNMVHEAAQILEGIFDIAYCIFPRLSPCREANTDIPFVCWIAKGTLPRKIQQPGQNLIPVICAIDRAQRGGCHFRATSAAYRRPALTLLC